MISRIVHCEGIVLRNLRYGETSRVATLLTAELGKTAVIAKGARDPKSQFGASLELFNLSGYVLYFRPGRDLQFLKSGCLEREHRGLLTDSRRYFLAAALAEFLDRVLMEETPGGGFFDLALRGFQVLESEPVDALQELFRGLQLRMATHLGYSPGLDCCGRCRCPVAAPADPAGRECARSWLFVPSEGGVVCRNCSAGESGGIRLGERELRRLRRMAVGPAGPARAAGVAEASNGWYRTREWLNDLDRLVEEFLRYHMDAYRGLRTMEILYTRDDSGRRDRNPDE